MGGVQLTPPAALLQVVALQQQVVALNKERASERAALDGDAADKQRLVRTPHLV